MKPAIRTVAAVLATVATTAACAPSTALATDASASISGTVTDANANPITTQDVCVEAYQTTGSDNWTYSASAVTDATGGYTLSDLPSGSYKVAFLDCRQLYTYVYGYGYGNYGFSTRNDVPEYYSGTTDWSSASLVVLSAGGAQAGIDAQLAPATSIAGHVYTSADESTPKESECVFAEQPSGEPPLESGFADYGPLSDYYGQPSADDGSYTLLYLPPSAEYVVEFSDCSQAKRYLTQFNGDASTAQAATPLSPTLAAPTTGIDAHLVLGGEISGSVTDAGGNAITTGDICVSADNIDETDTSPYDDYGYATTDAAGNYTIGGLSAGRYAVEFSDCDYDSTRNDVAQYYDDQSGYDTAAPITVTLGTTQTGIDAALAPATSISGHVYGSLDTSKPLSDICVDAYDASDNGLYPNEVSYAQTATDGSYELKYLPPGVGYKVYFEDCGDQGYTAQYYNNASDFTDAAVLTPTLADPSAGIDAYLASTTPVTQISGGPANGAATNSTTASFSFDSSIAGSTFECKLDSADFTPCTSPFATGAVANGPHTFTVQATANGIFDPDPPSVTWTVSPGSPTSTSQGSVPAGGTVSSDPGSTPSASDTVVVNATVPDAGTVTMTKEPATTPSQNGYTVFGKQLDIAATEPDGTTPLSGTVASPITLSFAVDSSAIPAGTDPSTITVLRNGVAAADCTGAPGAASPDPCVESRTPIAGGGETLTVLTTHCSLWNLATTQSSGPSTGPGASITHPSANQPVAAHASNAQIVTLLSRELTPSGKHARIAALLKAKGYSMLVRGLEPGSLTISWYYLPAGAKLAKKAHPKPLLVASGRQSFAAAGTKTIRVRLTSAGRRLLRRAKLLRVTASAIFTPIGNPAVRATRVFELRR